MDQVKFGKLLSELRNKRGLTQEEVGVIFGVTDKTVSKWECGNAVPDFRTLINISKEFKVSLYELSIGERVGKFRISRHDLLRVFSKNHFRLLTVKQKIFHVILLFLILIFVFCFSYTTTNYNKNKIYTLNSENSDFHIDGVFVSGKSYKTLVISDVKYVGDEYSKIYNKIESYYYEIYCGPKRIYHSNVFVEENKKDVLFYDMLRSISIILDNKNEDLLNVNVNQKLILVIYYDTLYQKDNFINFDIIFDIKN